MTALEAIGLICYPTIGGSGRVATELAGHLTRRGIEVHLLSYDRPGPLEDGVRFHRVHVMEYPLLRFPPYDQALATAILDLHLQQGVRLFHAHYALPHALAVILADLMLGGNRLRLVTTLHGTDITLVGGNAAYRRPLLFGLENSDLVTAVSSSLASDTRSIFGFEGRIDVIPNFVDSQCFEPGTEPRWPDRPPDSPRELVHISTFRPVKRVRDLILAVSLVRKRLPLRLTLVGEGPELEPCLQLSKELGLDADLRVVGAVEDPSPYLRDADLYVFSSRTESFGLGVLEAMASGVPVVGPRVGGVAEVVGDVGRLVRPSSPLALAEAAHELLTDRDVYREHCVRGRTRAVERFSPEGVVARYLEAYEGVLATT